MSMELPSVARLHPEPRVTTSVDSREQHLGRLSTVVPLPDLGLGSRRYLVYDLETYATGFADPNWVPQIITCVAWKWLGQKTVRAEASITYAKPGSMPHLQRAAVHQMLVPFLEALKKADGVITYNGARFDNPVLNGAMWYVGLPPVEPILTYDLHAFGKTKGVKKGLDNIATHLGAVEQKLAMNHAQWTEGYLEKGWIGIKKRARSDVVLTEEVFNLKREAGWLKRPKLWRP